MKLTNIPSPTQNYTRPTLTSKSDYSLITRYYDVAGPDYESWSKNFNMHFGFCRRFQDIFFLERMLKNMNDEVLKRLQVDDSRSSSLVDLGCGVGTVARHIADKLPLSQITGVTISDYQVAKCKQLNSEQKKEDRISIVKTNFESLDFADEKFTHAYALESSCYANGSGKDDFVAEMARVLQNGGRFCVADGFIKHHRKLPWLFRKLYTKVTRYWALPCFGNIIDFKTSLEKNGFKEIKIEEITWKIAPSVLYVPWTCVKFFAKEIWKNRSLRMKKERWHNVYAPILGMIMGLYQKHFGYYLISGRK